MKDKKSSGRNSTCAGSNRSLDVSQTCNTAYCDQRHFNSSACFPDEFKIVVADASAYKQFGNSVAVPAIRATAEKVIDKIRLNQDKFAYPVDLVFTLYKWAIL